MSTPGPRATVVCGSPTGVGEAPTEDFHAGAGFQNGHVAIGLATFLFVAAVLKTHDLATDPLSDGGHWQRLLGPLGLSRSAARWLALAAVEIELTIAFWLLSGLARTAVRVVTCCLFSLFAATSLYLATSGATDCGCFGRWSVNPWITFAADIAVLAILARWRHAPPHRIKNSVVTFTVARAPTWYDWRHAGVMAIGAVTMLAVAVPIVAAKPAVLTLDGQIDGDSKTVLLRPNEWVGERLPLLPFIDIGGRLSDGNWLVLLYRSDCAKCQEAMRDWEQWSRIGHSHTRNLALVQTDDGADGEEGSPGSWCLHGRLLGNRKWVLKTPLTIVLRQGTVVTWRNEEKGCFAGKGNRRDE